MRNYSFAAKVLLIGAIIAILFVFWRKPVITTVEALDNFRLENTVECAPPSYVPDDFLQKEIDVVTGIGEINFPIITPSAATQTYFNQGVAFYYNFEWVDAARSFHRAKTYDPNNAMVAWGLSKTYGSLNDTTVAREWANIAYTQALAGTSAFEKLVTRAQLVASAPAHDSVSIHRAELDMLAMVDTFTTTYAKIDEAWMLAADLRWNIRRPGEGRLLADSIAVQYFNTALKINSKHFGAWHLLVHGYEHLSQFEKALEYGNLYTQAAPAVPHAWHMYAHDLMKTGKVDEAIEKFNRAFGMEEARYKRENMPVHYDWHHPHNMELLAYCYQYKGQLEKAEAVFEKLDPLTAFVATEEGHIRKGHPLFLLQNGKNDEAIALAARLSTKEGVNNRMIGNMIEGLGYMLERKNEEALARIAKIDFIVDSLTKDGLSKGATEEEIADGFRYISGIKSLIQVGMGLQNDPTNATFQEPIAQIQKSMLQQTGPDPWIDALFFLQLLGNITYASGNMELAEASARTLLQHDRQYAGGHWLLAKVLLKRGKTAEAETALQKAREGYKDGDESLKRLLVKM
jgi:tetratricopeptide (TPR) repeat protein